MKPDWWTAEEWEEIVGWRERHKLATTERAFNTLLNQLVLSRDAGLKPDDILNTITERNWKTYKHSYMENVQEPRRQSNGFNYSDQFKGAL